MFKPLSIAEASSQIRRGILTPGELVERCLEQIRRYEDRLHAWVLVDADGARRAAETLQREEPRGPLHGIPLGIKDIVETYHNEPLRRRLRAKLPKLLEQGNFVEIYNTVADGAMRGADAQGFADATQAYAAITVEINHLDRGGGADPVQALQNGRQFAAGLSLFLALVTVAATVMIYK